MSRPVLSFLGDAKLEIGEGPETSHGSWTVKRGPDGIAWAIADQKDRSANVLSEAALEDLSAVLDDISENMPGALVLRSAKPSGFIAGADISEFSNASDEKETVARLRRAHDVIDRLEQLDCTTIAVLHGYAMGAGLELALACDHRIAIEGTRLSFPEVRLGLHPGLGGTFRLTERIDPVKAMTMMLTGKTADTRKAKRLGIVDIVAEERHVRKAVTRIAAGDLDKLGRGLKAAAMDLSPARQMAAYKMRTSSREKAPQDHYPAPYALIDLWEHNAGDREAMQAKEIESFARLLSTDTAQNLIRVFHLREKLKKTTNPAPDPVSHVHVIGAGTMGAEIAAQCARHGCRVTLQDIKLEPLGTAVRIAADVYGKAHMKDIEIRDALDRLIPDPQGHGARHADLVIEAAPEDVELKSKLLVDVEKRVAADTVIATNTSSLQLETLTGALKRPGRFAGLHFFNPVSRMQLVEVVTHAKTTKSASRQLHGFVQDIDRLPAEVRSYPGFLVNRALMPYLLEAALLVDEGLGSATVDKAAEEFGMPMGPLEVADRVGLDICLDVAESLQNNLDRPMPAIPAWLRKSVDKGDLGEKSGRGVYAWKDGKPSKPTPDDKIPEDITDRLILPMLDACVECLRKEVVSDADTADAALIFGAGFAPFRGGPMHYAHNRGAKEIAGRLKELSKKHGERFEPDPGWKELS